MAAVEKQIRAGADGYAELHDRVTRTIARARVLHLLDEMHLAPSRELAVEPVTPADLARDAVLRGAIVMHLDLVFRSSVSPPEVAHTAERGIVLVTRHPSLPEFPVAVVLAARTDKLIERRAQLFETRTTGAREPDVVMPYALAASPRRVGAGRQLLVELIRRCGAAKVPPRITTFSPLTGLRARVIRSVDDPEAWGAVVAASPGVDSKRMQSQLLELLSHDRLPEAIGEPARSWLQREAMEFAGSDAYQVGNFHRGMGAKLAGVLEQADPADSDALWWRAWFDYGRAVTSFSR